MYLDDYGNEYKTIEDAKKSFAKQFDEEINDIEVFSEELSLFTDLTDVLKILYEKDKTILDTLKNHYSTELERDKEAYIEDKIWELESYNEWHPIP